MSDRMDSVLVLCADHSARSTMAERTMRGTIAVSLHT
jgi:protein-tyrosine-phosphatase